MQYNDNAKLDPSQVGGGGGGGGRRGGIAVGGGLGLILLIVALLFGVDPGAILGSQPGDTQQTGGGNDTPYAHCTSGGDIQRDRECRWVAYTNSIQDYWGQALKGYEVTKVQTFTGQIQTGCGTADSSVGPFYCPADHQVYLDTAFFDVLTKQLGAQGGDSAEAYVIAHEFGHHIQNLTGTMEKAQSRQTGPKSPQVRLELQADCYAGVWLAHVNQDSNGPISGLTQDDLNRALDAAKSVGDDRIQERTQGRVDRESWTHGSAESRQYWLSVGFKSGDPNKCDTFASDARI